MRRGKDGKAELVLLDHGLYDRLKPHERKALCQLYKAIITLQEEDMEKYSKDLGVEGEALGTLSLSLPIWHHMTSMAKRFPLAKKMSWDALLELRLFVHGHGRSVLEKNNVSD